jgi:hypothetical protein
MPEIFPSAPNGNPATGIPANIDRCWTCRSMVMQAWGNYGTAWSVIHQQLGVRPFLNDSELQVVPQGPADQPSVEGSNIRLGRGAVDVFASHSGHSYTTKVDATHTPVRELLIGHTLPRGAHVASVMLDGHHLSRYEATVTNRGLEVTVHAEAGQRHNLTVTTA